jgi:hypothetical protein
MMEIMNHGELSSHREDKVYSRYRQTTNAIKIKNLNKNYSSREYFFSSQKSTSEKGQYVK